MEIKRDDLAARMIKEPHILIAGCTGSGKSTMLNNLIYALTLNDPNKVEYGIVDLKRVSLTEWKAVPHCKRYAVDPYEALELFDDVIDLMNQRFEWMEKQELKEYPGTYLYIIVDECAELLDTVKESYERLKEIARLGRAARIKLVLCTQSPNRKTIPADLTLNITGRLALRCQTAIESKQILNFKGAENLPRYGEGLWISPETMTPEKVTIPMRTEEEIETLVRSWKSQQLMSV